MSARTGAMPDPRGWFCGYCGEAAVVTYNPGRPLKVGCETHGGTVPLVKRRSEATNLRGWEERNRLAQQSDEVTPSSVHPSLCVCPQCLVKNPPRP